MGWIAASAIAGVALAGPVDTADTADSATFGVHVGCDRGPLVKINELLSNPDGTDSSVDAEWVEIFVNAGSEVDVSGWRLEGGTSSWNTLYEFAGGTVLSPGGVVVVGESMAPVVDFDAGTLGLGNASSNADAVRLVDCTGDPVDTVVYGPNNKADAWTDDSGAVATALAPTPPSDQSIGRLPDGADTDASDLDFSVFAGPTPGLSNSAPPVDCGGPGSGLVVNELRVNPAGSDSDAGTEFVELYHSGSAEIELEDWSVQSRTSPSSNSTQFSFESGQTIEPGQRLLIAGPAIKGADHTVSLSLPNGTDGDAVALLDCLGFAADTVVYGPNNDDLLVDDTGAVATSIALQPGDDEVLARISDGYDTDASATDFVLSLSATPGEPNPEVEPVECEPSSGGVVINELLPNPKGDDSGYEWVELYNGTGGRVNLGGWGLALATQGEDIDSPDLVFAGDVSLAAGAHLLVGGSEVGAADIQGSVSLGNGTDGDGARLLDCEGSPVDTVVWGSANKDLLPDDQDSPAVHLAPAPGDGLSLARVEDGYDTDNSAEDFVEQIETTPGSTNPVVEPVVCEPTTGAVRINEVLANPEGSDTDLEWVELYNEGSQPASVAGWGLALATNADNQDDVDVMLDAGLIIPAGGYLLIGDELVSEADVLASMSVPNGTSGDSVRLFDCEGSPVDTLVYGSDNKDLVGDDLGAPSESLAPAPGDGESLARIQDGYDTDQCAADFALSDAPTPGAANPEVEPVVCVPGTEGAVLINELLPDPDSTDTDYEWFELYNASSEAVSIAGWGVGFAGSGEDFETDSFDVSFEGGLELQPGDFLVVGGELVEEADVVASFSIGNGTGGDGARLFDCERQRMDTVLWGSDNEDLIPDDSGAIPELPSPDPGSAQSLARVEDGLDTDDVEDWFIDVSPTPGASNYQDEVDVPDPSESSGCFGKKSTPEGEEPGGCNSDSTVPSERGCVTVPLPLAGLELFAGLVVLRRRRRR